MNLFVYNIATWAFPSSFAVALAVDTSSVFRAGRIFAVRLVANLSFPGGSAVAGASDALSMAGAIGNPAVRLWNVAFWAFPTLLAVAEASAVLAVARAQDRTNACKGENFR